MKLGTILSAFLISIGNSDCNDGKVEFWGECYLINIQNLTNLMSVINIFCHYQSKTRLSDDVFIF